MSLSNPKSVVTEERLADFYTAIKPYIGGVEVDDSLSSSSENPVQNKVVKSALDGKANSSHTHTTTDITNFPTIPSNLGDLGDVDTTSATDGQVLKKVNGTWVGATESGGTPTWGNITGTLADQTDLNTALGNKTDKVTSATNGNFAGLDSNGNLIDSGSKASDFLTSHQSLANYYSTQDTAETTFADDDYLPFYDTSATAKRKSTWSNVKAKLKAYFDTIYSTLTIGTTATTAAAGNHTHTTTIASDSGTSALDMQANTKYKISTGDTTFIFKTPSDTNNRRVFYGTCTTAADTQVKSVTLSSTTGWELVAGTVVGVLFSNTNTYSSTTSAPVKLNINSTGDKDIKFNGTLGTAGNTGTNWNVYGGANHVHYYMYDGTNWVWMGIDYNDGNNYHASCWTAGGTADKTANASWYVLRDGNIFTLYLNTANTSASALTLNVNGTGAKSLYINGSASSSSNYSLPAGTYQVLYQSNIYYVRTDGKTTTNGYVDSSTNNCMVSTRRLTKTVSAGATGVGTWDDSSTPTETDWWQSDIFKFPASANSKNIDIAFKFDPEYGNGEVVALGGYILDTSTGKLCIKFANAVTNAQLIAVDVTYTPTYS